MMKLPRLSPRGVWTLAFAASFILGGNASAQVPTYPFGGRVKYVDGYLTVHLAGTPEEMGRQQGMWLGGIVRRMIQDLIYEGTTYGGEESYRRLIKGAKVMDRFQPPEVRAEMRALAEAANVKYYDVVLAQLFGDVRRGQQCTSFAALGPATGNGQCVVGRNMDYYDYGVSKYAAALVYYEPSEGIPFVTATWVGILNGWTLMNQKGIVVANNSSYGGTDSLKGISTCFMLRKVAQFASTVEEGIEIVKQTPRACGTNMLIAGGSPPRAAIVEFDHENVAVRWAEDGLVAAANSFRKLYQVEEEETEEEDDDTYTYYYKSRDDTLLELLQEDYGRIDDSKNYAAAPGVPMRGMNLQCALLFPNELKFRISIGSSSAADERFRAFKLTPQGLEADDSPGANLARLWEPGNYPMPSYTSANPLDEVPF
ncbi:MAG: C45 family autoproteolytic acyltransferase/hydrolase [Armatimonadota bacterium]